MSTNQLTSGIKKANSFQEYYSATQTGNSDNFSANESLGNLTYSPTAPATSRQSLTSELDHEPLIWINKTNYKSTRADSVEIDKFTRESDQIPEVLLPQEMIADIHPINTIDSDTVVIQIWEGCVQSVDVNERKMKAVLNAKMGQIPEHVGTIDLQWVPAQDSDLIMPGAVFYLTLFKRVKKGGTIENSQEIRFRRRPNWSKNQIAKFNVRATELLSKFKSKPIAE